MKLKDQVVSREIGMKIKKLGVKQESEFYWSKNGGLIQPIDANNQYIDCAAFTVAELGEMLPEKINGDGTRLQITKHENRYVAMYRMGAICTMETLTDTMGTLLIILIENKLIEVAKNVAD